MQIENKTPQPALRMLAACWFGIRIGSKLADPELKKNVHGDDELEKAHKRMKSDLNLYLETMKLDFGVPAPVRKGFASVIPWLMLGFAMFFVTKRGEFGQLLGGMLVIATPFIAIGVLLPTYDAWWINYFAFPFGSVFIVLMVILGWQHVTKKAL